MTIRTKIAPAVPAISKETLKNKHLRIVGTQDDGSLDDLYIPSAIRYFEFITGRALITQTLVQSFDRFPCQSFFFLERVSPKINDTPTIVINSIKYYNSEGVLTIVSTDVYDVAHENLPASVILKPNQSWPSDLHYGRVNCVEVEYVAGYGNTEASIPKEFHHCMALLCGESFVFREDDLYSPGGTIAQPSKTSYDYLCQHMTGFYEHRSQQWHI